MNFKNSKISEQLINRDSWEFKRKIDSTFIPDNPNMISLDVTLLFKNIIGSSMGSKILSVLSNIVIEDLEIAIISKIKTKLKVRLMNYYRSVDDIYTIVLTLAGSYINYFSHHPVNQK